jgi:hypothetical protein
LGDAWVTLGSNGTNALFATRDEKGWVGVESGGRRKDHKKEDFTAD